MNIHTAIHYAYQGYKIRREAWVAPNHVHCELKDIYIKDGLIMSFNRYAILTAEDLIADDWVIVVEN